MKSDEEIRQEGKRALINALGPVEAERFVATLLRDRFDYTEWRKAGLPEIDIETLSLKAAEVSARIDQCARAIAMPKRSHFACYHSGKDRGQSDRL